MDTYRVVMRNTRPDGWVEEACDPHVPEHMLDAYLTDARTRWADVTVTRSTSEGENECLSRQ